MSFVARLLLLVAVWAGAGLTGPGRAAAQAIPPVGAPSTPPVAVPPVTTAPPTDGRLVQVSADVLEQTIENGRRVQRLTGNVVLVQETTTITAERARRVLDEGVAYLSGRVRVIQLGDTLDAPEVRYDENTRVGVATGGIRLANEDAVVRAAAAVYDTRARRATINDPLRLTERGGALLTAPRAVYLSDARRADMEGGLRLVDSTVVMTARRGAYFLDEKRAEFEGDVRLVDSTSTLTALRGIYYRDSERAVFQGDVRLVDSTGVLTAPSVVYFRREAQAVFEEGVRLTDSTSVLTARSGVYLRREQQAGFVGDVRLVRRDTSQSGVWTLDRLAADTLLYRRAERIATARSRVTLVRDEGDVGRDVARTRAVLLADVARDDARAGTSRAERRAGRPAPLFVRVGLDSLGAPRDTLALVADRLDLARDSLRQTLAAAGDVRLVGKDAAAASDSAFVLRLDPDGTPRDDIRLFGTRAAASATPPPPDSTAAPATLTAASTASTPPSPALTPPPVAWTAQSSTSTGSPAASMGSPVASTPSPADSTATAAAPTGRRPVAFVRRAQVTADSLRITAVGGEADSLIAVGGAFVAERDSVSGRLHQAKGDRLLGRFLPGERRTFTLGPRAEVLRWMATDAGERDGAVVATADRVVVETEGDRLRRFDAFDGIEGTQYAENVVPAGLALTGLVWTPERRPSWAMLTAGRRLPTLAPRRGADADPGDAADEAEVDDAP